MYVGIACIPPLYCHIHRAIITVILPSNVQPISLHTRERPLLCTVMTDTRRTMGTIGCSDVLFPHARSAGPRCFDTAFVRLESSREIERFSGVFERNIPKRPLRQLSPKLMCRVRSYRTRLDVTFECTFIKFPVCSFIGIFKGREAGASASRIHH